MSSKKFFCLLVVLLISIQFALAGNLIIYKGTGPENICPSSTDLFTDVIENNGDDPIEISISNSGTASVFATTVPQGWILNPGETKNIYTYITPSSYADIGQYNLNIIANSESLTHTIDVMDCFEYSLNALTPEKNICPCESESFDFKLDNNGQYVETYSLSVEGTYPGVLTLSENIVSLMPGESKTFHVYIESDCSSLGNYEFTIVATPVTGGLVRSASSKLIIGACYDFRLDTEKNSVSFCEHSQETIGLTIFNEGSTSNTFDFNLDGPAWANLEKNTLEVGPGNSKSVNLILSPDYGVKGNFEIELGVSPDKGNIQAFNVFNVNIKKCHAVSIDIEKNSDTMCNSLENNYVVNVINNGEYSKEYYLELDSPDWVSIDKRSLSLGVGEEEQVILNVNPSYDVVPATYFIKLSALAKDSSQVADFDKIDITTVTREECYKVLLGIEDNSVGVYYDSSATVPIIIENIGSDTTSYEISLTGSASEFVYLNPAIVTLDSSKSELVYLYVAPTGDVIPGNYEILISARLEDSTILTSEKVYIKVKEGTEKPVKEKGVSIFDRFLGFFKELIENFRKDEVSKEINETFDDIEEEPEVIGDLISVGNDIEFEIGEEAHTLKYESKESDGVLILISSDPIYVALVEGEVKEIDMDGDEIADIKVIFNGFIDDKADISYEILVDELKSVEESPEEVPEESPEEDIPEEDAPEENLEKESFISSFISAVKNILVKLINDVRTYRTQLIVIIVALILILLSIRTNFLKKIKDFFEEEIEEEPLIIEEEKPKEEKPKEEKLKEEKPKLEKKEKKIEKEIEKEIEDDEDFIIEFDDEDKEK